MKQLLVVFGLLIKAMRDPEYLVKRIDQLADDINRFTAGSVGETGVTEREQYGTFRIRLVDSERESKPAQWMQIETPDGWTDPIMIIDYEIKSPTAAEREMLDSWLRGMMAMRDDYPTEQIDD